MRLVGGAAILALVLWVAASAFATTPAKLRFGVYTMNVGLGGSGHLEGEVSVLDPPTKVTLVFACGKPTSAVDSVTEQWDSPTIPLHSGTFSVHRTVTLIRTTTVTKTNAFVARSRYTGAVDAEGSFNAHDQFVGTIQIQDSPCQRTSYTANRLAGPTLTGPTP